MGQTEATRQADFIIAPQSGVISVLSVGSADDVDLTQLGNQSVGNDQEPSSAGPIGHYCAFQADGADVYVVFGPTEASVSGANAPNPSATGINITGGCTKIPDGAILQVKVRPQDRFMGFVGTGGVLRVFQAST